MKLEPVLCLFEVAHVCQPSWIECTFVNCGYFSWNPKVIKFITFGWILTWRKNKQLLVKSEQTKRNFSQGWVRFSGWEMANFLCHLFLFYLSWFCEVNLNHFKLNNLSRIAQHSNMNPPQWTTDRVIMRFEYKRLQNILILHWRTSIYKLISGKNVCEKRLTIQEQDSWMY